MKRLSLLAAALVMVLGMAVNASAAPEVAISGNILVNAVWNANWDFNSQDAAGDDGQAFRVLERANLAFTITANENLKGVLNFRSTRGSWGQGAMANGAMGGGGYTPGAQAGIGLQQAYLDFNWPGTSVNVKAGMMPVAMPAAVGGGSMIQDDNATGVMISTNITDGIDITGGWVRFYDSNTANLDTTYDSQIDAWILALPVSMEGFSVAPFLAYAPLGENAVNTIAPGAASVTIDGLASIAQAGDITGSIKVKDAYWLGTPVTLSFLDPFIIKGDINYGAVSGENEYMDRKGWLFDIALEYTGFDFMNLELAYAYTTGEDDDTSNGSERMPIMSDSWALGSFFFGGGLITGDDLGSGTNLGFHAVALSATGIQSFAEGLTHDAHIVYAKGTNAQETAGLSLAGLPGTGTSTTGIVYGTTLTEKDKMWEVDFNSMYQIYDELTLYNGIGYINLDADESAAVWGPGNNGGDAWKFQIGAVYQF